MSGAKCSVRFSVLYLSLVYMRLSATKCSVRFSFLSLSLVHIPFEASSLPFQKLLFGHCHPRDPCDILKVYRVPIVLRCDSLQNLGCFDFCLMLWLFQASK